MNTRDSQPPLTPALSPMAAFDRSFTFDAYQPKSSYLLSDQSPYQQPLYYEPFAPSSAARAVLEPLHTPSTPPPPPDMMKKLGINSASKLAQQPQSQRKRSHQEMLAKRLKPLPVDHSNQKPSYSYASLIVQALVYSEDGRLTLKEIYQWIMSTYSYYRHSSGNWQNSIRHNLSLNNYFTKMPKINGKGSYWTLDPQCLEKFEKKGVIPSGSKEIMEEKVDRINEEYENYKNRLKNGNTKMQPTKKPKYEDEEDDEEEEEPEQDQNNFNTFNYYPKDQIQMPVLSQLEEFEQQQQQTPPLWFSQPDILSQEQISSSANTSMLDTSFDHQNAHSFGLEYEDFESLLHQSIDFSQNPTAQFFQTSPQMFQAFPGQPLIMPGTPQQTTFNLWNESGEFLGY